MNVSGYQDFINKFGKDNINHFQPLKSCTEILGKISSLGAGIAISIYQVSPENEHGETNENGT